MENAPHVLMSDAQLTRLIQSVTKPGHTLPAALQDRLGQLNPYSPFDRSEPIAYWARCIDDELASYQVPPAERKILLTNHLRDGALICWTSELANAEYSDALRALVLKFTNDSDSDQLFKMLSNRKFKGVLNESLYQFSRDLIRLAKAVNSEAENNPDRLNSIVKYYFIKGLPEPLSSKLDSHLTRRIVSPDELVAIAFELSRQLAFHAKAAAHRTTSADALENHLALQNVDACSLGDTYSMTDASSESLSFASRDSSFGQDDQLIQEQGLKALEQKNAELMRRIGCFEKLHRQSKARTKVPKKSKMLLCSVCRRMGHIAKLCWNRRENAHLREAGRSVRAWGRADGARGSTILESNF